MLVSILKGHLTTYFLEKFWLFRYIYSLYHLRLLLNQQHHIRGVTKGEIPRSSNTHYPLRLSLDTTVLCSGEATSIVLVYYIAMRIFNDFHKHYRNISLIEQTFSQEIIYPLITFHSIGFLKLYKGLYSPKIIDIFI